MVYVDFWDEAPKGHTFADHSSQYPYIRVIDFKNNSIDESNLKFLTQEDGELLKRYTISSKDVYISIAGTIGLSGFVPDYLDNANLTENAAKIIINDETQMDKYFLTYFLQCHKGQEQITIRTSKTSQPKLALIRIKQIPIPLPPLPEQRAIAKVLSTAQQAKEKTDTVISATKELKKSLMRHLFTYGPVPVKKFNELGVDELQNAQNSKNSKNSSNSIKLKETEIGLVPEEWDVVRLGDVVKKTEQKDPRKTPEWQFKYIDVSSINREDLKIVEYKLCQGKDAPSRAKKVVKINDVIFATVRPTLRRLTLIEDDFDGEMCSTAFCVLRAKKSFLSSLYLLYAVQRDIFIEELGKIQRGASYPAVTDSDVKNQILPLPPLPTQQKIATNLSAVDKKIEAEETKKKALDVLFKSLLHNLMTGKLRVNELQS